MSGLCPFALKGKFFAAARAASCRTRLIDTLGFEFFCLGSQEQKPNPCVKIVMAENEGLAGYALLP
jgi:hypothetical protein